MLNSVSLIGRLGKEVEVKVLQSGMKVATLTIATSESYKDKTTGEKVEQTEWHQVNLWDKLADIAEKYLMKGSLVFIEGKIQTRTYDDKNGEKRYATSIKGNSLKMLGSKGDS